MMKNLKLPVYIFLMIIPIVTSCVTYKVFPSPQPKGQEVNWSDPDFKVNFEKERVYRIKLKDKQTFDLIKVEKVGENLMGVQKKYQNLYSKGNCPDMEIPKSKINNIYEKEQDLVASAVLIGVSAIILFYGFWILVVVNTINSY
jgi:hypothetical protein